MDRELDESGYTCIENALLRKKTERIPCFPLIDAAFASTYSGISLGKIQLNPGKHAKALTACVERLPVDGVYINLTLGSCQFEKLNSTTYSIDGFLTVVVPEKDVLSISSTDILSLDDPRLETAELFHPGMLEVYENIPDSCKKEYAIVTGITGTFSQVAFILGVQNLLMAIMDYPSKVKRALDSRHEAVLRQVDQLCDCGARFVWIGEGLGSGSLISPETYRDFVLPYEKSIADRLRERKALSILHICGDTRKTLRYIADSRVDGFDLDFPVSIPEALKALPQEITIKGNINPSLFLPGRTAELKKACSEAIGFTRNAPSFILSTGCLVPRDSDNEAFHAMRSVCVDIGEVRKHGK